VGKPYWSSPDDAHVVHHGDALEVMATMYGRDQLVDHIITDPPYAARSMKNARSGSDIAARRDGKAYTFGYAAITDDQRIAAAALFALVARRWIITWTDLESISAWIDAYEAAGIRYVRTGIWVRQHGAPQFSGDRPAQAAEACVIGHAVGTRLRWNGGGHPAAWVEGANPAYVGPIVNARDGRRAGHRSPKPEWLMAAQVRQFTDPGETILDPFMGSATLLRVAKDAGRGSMGVDIDEVWCARAVLRMAQARMDLGIDENAALGPSAVDPEQVALL